MCCFKLWYLYNRSYDDSLKIIKTHRVNLEPQIWQTWGFGIDVGSVRRRTGMYWPVEGRAGRSGWVSGFPVRVRPTTVPGVGMHGSVSIAITDMFAWFD